MRRGSKPTKAKVQSKRSAPKSQESEASRVRDLEGRLAEALEQQTATAEILRVISNSPTDIKPVLDAVAGSAMRLCESYDAGIMLREGEELHFPVHHGPIRWPVQLTGRAISRGWVAGRAVLDRQPVHVHDLATAGAEFPVGQADAVRAGYRTTLSVPLLREGEAIGVIHLRRREVRPFTDKQIALVETFAAQAVIAIENVRLFRELQEKNCALSEALERQTATSEILRVISQSPTSVQPMFDAVAGNAARLCEAFDALIYRRDGDVLRLVAHHGSIPAPGPIGEFTRPLSRGMVSGRSVLDARTVHVRDMQIEASDFPETAARRIGSRTVLGVPLVREGVAIGTIILRRTEARPFSAANIALLETFADQAVIAIENVRLFTELQEKNRALTAAHSQITEALEQQTATSEILRVISRSRTNVQPVFDAIVRSAVRLCDGLFSGLYQFDGEVIEQVAQHNYSAEALDVARRIFPMRPNRAIAAARAILERAVVHLPDVELDAEYRQAIMRAVGARSVLCVPMLKDGVPVGAIGVARAEPGHFSDEQIELLKTFADQAVIAIENARLLTELQQRTEELTRSVEQLTALGDVGQAVSSTLDLATVLTTIASRTSQLAGTRTCTVYEYDEAGEAFHLRATHNVDESVLALTRVRPIRKGEGVAGRVAETLAPVQIEDITVEASYRGGLREVLIGAGVRAVLAVPLLRESRLIGALIVTRNKAGRFADEVIALLETFATQSTLAIQNARLFREIEQKSRELEAASQHKSEFLANMSHELRTPLNAIIGFSEVLGERMFGELNEKQDEYLKDIHASGQHLLSLINDILDLSKIEAGRMELELSAFDLPMTIDNALTLIRERAGRRSIGLNMTVDERLGQIQGDERKIRQVLLNLLSNAIKFTPEGGRIDVGAKPVDGFIEVSVSDTGVGIAPEDQEAVFEEFRQVGTADKKVEGTGLGLALSRKFIELHGGKIWVKSQVGEGSTFTFTVPVRRGE